MKEAGNINQRHAKHTAYCMTMILRLMGAANFVIELPKLSVEKKWVTKPLGQKLLKIKRKILKDGRHIISVCMSIRKNYMAAQSAIREKLSEWLGSHVRNTIKCLLIKNIYAKFVDSPKRARVVCSERLHDLWLTIATKQGSLGGCYAP